MTASRDSSPDIGAVARRLTFEEITATHETFGDSHRFLLQYMLSHPVCSMKQFYLKYLHYYVEVILEKDPVTIANVAASEEDLTKLVDELIDTCNDKLSKVKMQLSKYTGEENGEISVILISNKAFGEVFHAICGLSTDDDFMLSAIIEQMAHNEGQVHMQWVRDKALTMNNQYSLAKLDHMIGLMCRQKFFAKKRSHLVLDARGIVELEPVLRFTFNWETCSLCRSIVIGKRHAIKCSNELCDVLIHPICWDKFAAQCPHDIIDCMNDDAGCTKKFSKERVEKQREKSRKELKKRARNEENGDSEGEDGPDHEVGGSGDELDDFVDTVVVTPRRRSTQTSNDESQVRDRTGATVDDMDDFVDTTVATPKRRSTQSSNDGSHVKKKRRRSPTNQMTIEEGDEEEHDEKPPRNADMDSASIRRSSRPKRPSSRAMEAEADKQPATESDDEIVITKRVKSKKGKSCKAEVEDDEAEKTLVEAVAAVDIHNNDDEHVVKDEVDPPTTQTQKKRKNRLISE